MDSLYRQRLGTWIRNCRTWIMMIGHLCCWKLQRCMEVGDGNCKTWLWWVNIDEGVEWKLYALWWTSSTGIASSTDEREIVKYDYIWWAASVAVAVAEKFRKQAHESKSLHPDLRGFGMKCEVGCVVMRSALSFEVLWKEKTWWRRSACRLVYKWMVGESNHVESVCHVGWVD